MSDTTPTTVEKTPSAKAKPLHVSYVPGWLSAWVPIVTALISLAISLYTFVVTTTKPDVLLIMPEQVRIAQGGASGPLLYMRPTFVSTGQSERVEVITSIRVEVEPTMQSPGSEEFVWDEQGSWVVDPTTQYYNWVTTDEPGPFLLSSRNAQVFTGLFIGPNTWLFEPGTYRITLIADRITNPQPLRASIEIILSDENIEYLNQAEGATFLIFPARNGD